MKKLTKILFALLIVFLCGCGKRTLLKSDKGCYVVSDIDYHTNGISKYTLDMENNSVDRYESWIYITGEHGLYKIGDTLTLSVNKASSPNKTTNDRLDLIEDVVSISDSTIKIGRKTFKR